MTDGQEVNVTHTNPLKADSDGDGISDADEVNLFRTNPNSADTDRDGIADDVELRAGSNPNDPGSTPLPSDGPTSDQLIDAALTAGQLTSEQALI